MGIIAFVKQTLLDAGHYGTAWSIYNANPGVVRPEYSRALESLQPLIKKESRVVLSADNPTEIQRILDLVDAFKLNLILSGGAEAKGIAAVLRERSIPVLLSVKYPERDREADPEMKDELDVLRRRVEAPANAAALAKAGVKFAFQSGDTANPKDFIRNVGKAVEAGLDKETALRALTLTPAEILGVSDRLGSIEKNKTANLIITTGDIFDAKTKVKIAFVDGRKFGISEPAEPPVRSAEGGSAADENSGRIFPCQGGRP
jgi:imidazolonepropionase-like amidohydrolase